MKNWENVTKDELTEFVKSYPYKLISLDQVHYIRNNYKRGDPNYGAKALSQKFGVAPQTISAVATKQNWSGIE